jgi:hypothetical protein
MVCDLAQIEFGTASEVKQIKNYYVLVLMMAGVIDDFQEALNQILRAAHLPVSVIVIKVGNISDDNDSSLLIKNAMKTFNECERTFIEVLSYDQYKSTNGQITTMMQQQFEFDLIKSIPAHVEKFFEI